MDTKEFLESQGTDSQELKQAKKDVLDNALSSKRRYFIIWWT